MWDAVSRLLAAVRDAKAPPYRGAVRGGGALLPDRVQLTSRLPAMATFASRDTGFPWEPPPTVAPDNTDPPAHEDGHILLREDHVYKKGERGNRCRYTELNPQHTHTHTRVHRGGPPRRRSTDGVWRLFPPCVESAGL